MGFFNSFKKMVVNYSNIKVTEKLDYDRLLAIIKDGSYPLPAPEITGSGIMRAIRFNPTGKYQIMVALSGKTVSVVKNFSGAGEFVKSMAKDSVTDGWYSLANKENLDGNEIVELIGKEICRLLDEQGLLMK
ncbi:hypothetical protein [uncultured Robinsoniella sp.]|uniref:hypothetical protein n=1 Tax=uncultured Robinsoniella sp. TaxID=904190 RepID=UPI00374FCD23